MKKKKPLLKIVSTTKTKAGQFIIYQSDNGFHWTIKAANGTVTVVSSPVKVADNCSKNARSVLKTLSAVFK